MIDAIVTGRSLPALQSALDLAEVGLKVALLRSATSAPVELLAERDPEGSIAQFIERIAEAIQPQAQEVGARDTGTEAVRRVMPQPPLLHKQGEWLRQSSPEVFGVPAVPLASENIALLGSGGAFRAFLDRITPLLTVGKTRLLGELVRKRMGPGVRRVLVDPQVFERFGVLSDQVEVAIAAPGLNEALSRSGALSSAVLAYSDRNVARETQVSLTHSPVNFHRAALKRLELYGVHVLEAHLASVQQLEEGWSTQLSDGTSVNSRSLIVDLDRNLIPEPAVYQLVAPVLPTHARVHAVIDMEAPAWLEDGATALAVLDGWSLSYTSVPEAEPNTELMPESESKYEEKSEQKTERESGSEPPHSEYSLHSFSGKHCELRMASGIGDPGQLADALRRITATQRLPISSPSPNLNLNRNATVCFASLAAAPFCTVASRSAAMSALEQHGQNVPSLLQIGRVLHGDDQGAAMSAAHASAVLLRRRLLGLEE